MLLHQQDFTVEFHSVGLILVLPILHLQEQAPVLKGFSLPARKQYLQQLWAILASMVGQLENVAVECTITTYANPVLFKISKATEKVVALRLNRYLVNNNLHEMF